MLVTLPNPQLQDPFLLMFNYLKNKITANLYFKSMAILNCDGHLNFPFRFLDFFYAYSMHSLLCFSSKSLLLKNFKKKFMHSHFSHQKNLCFLAYSLIVSPRVEFLKRLFCPQVVCVFLQSNNIFLRLFLSFMDH